MESDQVETALERMISLVFEIQRHFQAQKSDLQH
jgi:hypothetical protein